MSLGRDGAVPGTAATEVPSVKASSGPTERVAPFPSLSEAQFSAHHSPQLSFLLHPYPTLYPGSMNPAGSIQTRVSSRLRSARAQPRRSLGDWL